MRRYLSTGIFYSLLFTFPILANMPILIFNWKIISLINIWTILICLEPQPKLEASIDKKNKIIISLTGIAVIQLSVFEWVYNISALFFVEITGVFVIILGFFIRAWALNILQGNFSKEITTFKVSVP